MSGLASRRSPPPRSSRGSLATSLVRRSVVRRSSQGPCIGTIVLIAANELVEHVVRIAAESYEGSVQNVLDAAAAQYAEAITNRRPDEVLAQ